MGQAIKQPTKRSQQTADPKGQVERLVSGPKCPDFDEDCFEVEDKVKCWTGWMPCPEPLDINIGIAKGYCPFLRGH